MRRRGQFPLSLRERVRVGGRSGSILRLVMLGVFMVGCTKRPETISLVLLSPTTQRVELAVEMADTPEERSRGLMFREELPEGQGMLFVFDKPQMLRFWMKNTRIPLDILFFGEWGNIVSASTMEPCASDPCPTYSSAAEARYALEVPAGFIERYDVGRGWSFDDASTPILPQRRLP